MSLSRLFSLLKSQHIRDVDHALAMSLQRLAPETPELVCIAAAMASKAHSLGHSCLPLDKFKELLTEASTNPAIDLPASEEFLAALSDSDWVGKAPSGNTVFVLDGMTIALQRYWDYENGLAEALRQRLAMPAVPLSGDALQGWATLFSDDNTSAQALAAKRACESVFFLLTVVPAPERPRRLVGCCHCCIIKPMIRPMEMPRHCESVWQHRPARRRRDWANPYASRWRHKHWRLPNRSRQKHCIVYWVANRTRCSFCTMRKIPCHSMC